jgi:hypothetical protein
MRKISVYCEHYDCQIIYLVGSDVHALKKYLSRKHGADAKFYSWATEFKFDNTTNGYQFHVNADLGDGEIFYVWLAYLDAYLLSHETLHLSGDILYTRGISYSYSSEETFAYLHGWIFDKIFKKLKGRLPKR